MTHHKVPFMYLSEVGADVGLGTAGRFSTAQGIIGKCNAPAVVHLQVCCDSNIDLMIIRLFFCYLGLLSNRMRVY